MSVSRSYAGAEVGDQQGTIEKLRWRAGGLPRSLGELQASLLALRTLREQGWHESVAGAVQTHGGEPTPWWTYAAVRFLESLDTADNSVLEFGSGASTKWLAARFSRVRSMEHDAAWVDEAQPAANAEIVLRPAAIPDDLTLPWPCDYLCDGADGGPWDVVIVDGIGRQTAVEHIDEFVKPNGLVLLDDSDTAQLEPAQRILAEAGFGRIDFWGFRPGVALTSCTSVFSRDFNRWLIGAR